MSNRRGAVRPPTIALGHDVDLAAALCAVAQAVDLGFEVGNQLVLIQHAEPVEPLQLGSSWNEKRSADLAESTEFHQTNGCHAGISTRKASIASWPDSAGRQAAGEPARPSLAPARAP